MQYFSGFPDNLKELKDYSSALPVQQANVDW
jgi:hypothetical protein